MLHLPSPLASARHSLPAVLEGMVLPFALFTLVLWTLGLRPALIAGLAWSYLAVVRRLLKGDAPPATIVLGSAMLSVRTAVAFATGSAFIYFVQPVAATATVALAFLASALVRRPLTERFAKDFCPLDPATMARPAVRRFFVRVTFLWSFVLLANAGLVLWFLCWSSLGAFVVERTAVSWTLTGMAIVFSAGWFVRSMRRDGITVRWGGAAPTGGVPGA